MKKTISKIFIIFSLLTISLPQALAETHIIESDLTCMDEYIAQDNQYKMNRIVTPLKGLGVAAGTGGATYLVAVEIAKNIGYVGYEIGLTGLVFGVFVGTAVIGTTIGLTTNIIIKRIKNNFILKTVANSIAGAGPSLDRFTKRFLRKYKIRDDEIDSTDIGTLLTEADREGVLCDGSLVIRKKRNEKLKYKLANKEEIFNYLAQELGFSSNN